MEENNVVNQENRQHVKSYIETEIGSPNPESQLRKYDEEIQSKIYERMLRARLCVMYTSYIAFFLRLLKIEYNS